MRKTNFEKVSVLTPTWNRADFIPKVYASIATQTYTNIEWIVVDDGSEDCTSEVLDSILMDAMIPITYAAFPKRVGKCRADNTLLDLANGDFVIWCDSDDTLEPHAVENLINAWKTVPDDQRKDFIGVIAICKDQNGTIQSTGKHPFEVFVAPWRSLMLDMGMQGDMCIMQRRERIADRRFPEHDLVMSESGFWHQFMQLKVVCLPDILKVMNRETQNRISGSKRMEYCRGKAYSIVYADSATFNQRSPREQLRIATNYHRYCTHGELGIGKRNRLFLGQRNFFYYMGLVTGILMAAKDMFQGRVFKTHRIFENSRSTYATVRRNFDITQTNSGSRY